jgi:hypothetical protein
MMDVLDAVMRVKNMSDGKTGVPSVKAPGE